MLDVQVVDNEGDRGQESSHGSLEGLNQRTMTDGRNDSPDFSAQYLTYILIEETTKDVLDVQVVDKRETGGKSPLMELEGLKRGMTDGRNDSPGFSAQYLTYILKCQITTKECAGCPGGGQ